MLYIYIYIYILHVIISHGHTHGATTMSSLSHQSFRLVKSIESMAPGCCGDPWWTLGFGWGTLCSQCQVSCQRLRRIRFRSDFKRDFLATSHSFPIRAFSLVMLQLLQVLCLLNLNVCHIYDYIYIYIYVHRSFVVTCTISHVYTYIIIYIHTLHYITLQYIILHYTTLHYITLHYITLHHIKPATKTTNL